MNSNTILQSDVLDIIFDNRNKAYGAYALRKFYNARLQRSLAVTMLLVVIISGATFLTENTSGNIEVVDIVLSAVKMPALSERKILPQQKKINQKMDWIAITHSNGVMEYQKPQLCLYQMPVEEVRRSRYPKTARQLKQCRNPDFHRKH